MTKVAVIGAGLQGTAVAYGLSVLKHTVYLSDNDPEQLEESKKKIKSLGGEIQVIPFERLADHNIQTVVAATPYTVNEAITKFCAKHRKNRGGFRYCDLGGNPSVSKRVQTVAEEMDVPVITDLGLAPGLVNILAEDMFSVHKDYTPVTDWHEKGVEGIRIRVGGLPRNPTGMLQYARVFGLIGLQNEYTGPCKALVNGEIVETPALSQIETLSCWRGLELEAFTTKGGLSSTLPLMKERGIKNCDYKTLRYPGHANYIRLLLQECGLGKVMLANGKPAFYVAIENACPETDEDVVFVFLEFWMHDGASRKKYFTIDCDENWSAMQKGTAFPTAVVASIMASGDMDGNNILTYADIPLESFKDKLKQIGDNNVLPSILWNEV